MNHKFKFCKKYSMSIKGRNGAKPVAINRRPRKKSNDIFFTLFYNEVRENDFADGKS